MADLVYWIAQNPPPAHFFLISGDKDFANILHRLRMSNYNILLACPSADPSVLCSAATIMWPWEALVNGVGFSPKHFNHPPDGLSSSWYSHYRGALDDPFLQAEPKHSMTLPMTLPMHTKKAENPPVVPKFVIHCIRRTLNSYSEGVNIQDLRSELKRNGVPTDKGFFGFKTFTDLLQALPEYVKFIDPLPGDSLPAVVGEKNFKIIESGESNGEVKCLNESKTVKSPSSSVPSSPSDILSAEQKKIPAVDTRSSLSDSLSRDQRKAPPIDFITQSEPPACHMEADAVTASGTPLPGLQGTSKKGLFERIRILWNGPSPTMPETYHSKGSDNVARHGGHNTDQHNRHFETINKNVSRTDNLDVKDLGSHLAVGTSLSNFPSTKLSDLNVKENFANSKNQSSKAENVRGLGETNYGIFSWAARWWSSGKSATQENTDYTDVTDETKEDLDKGSAFVKRPDSASGQQVGAELFEKSYFWDALEQYLLTPHGSKLVSEAKTRDELAHGLQKQGCWPLKGLDKKNLHQLVHLLVSEKKWIQESNSETFHFLLTLPQRGGSAPLPSSKSGGSSPFARPARNRNGQASYKGDENQGNGDDLAWEELGPVSSSSDPRQETDKVPLYQPPTPSDDDFSDDETNAASLQERKDSDDEFREDENHEASQQGQKDESGSSLVKILALWSTSKDDGSRKRDHGVGRLHGTPPRNIMVDCSRSDGSYRQCWRPSSKHHS